jgi:hypothetical protein
MSVQDRASPLAWSSNWSRFSQTDDMAHDLLSRKWHRHHTVAHRWWQEAALTLTDQKHWSSKPSKAVAYRATLGVKQPHTHYSRKRSGTQTEQQRLRFCDGTGRPDDLGSGIDKPAANVLGKRRVLLD